MNRFDFIQFSIPSQCIIEPNENLLSTVREINGKLRYLLGDDGRNKISKHDYRIEFKLMDEKALIGISSKVLGIDYPELIHGGNLSSCFDKLRTFGLFKEVDKDMALREGKCNRLEVTRDIMISLDKAELEDISKMVLDVRRWVPQLHKRSFGVMRSDKSESIKYYDKEHEMALSKHKEYVREFKLEGKFDGLVRVESKLQTSAAVRKRFGDNNLSHVLTSISNPLLDITSEVFVKPEDLKGTKKAKANLLKSHRDRERLSYAMEFDCDLGAIAEDMKRRDRHNWSREFGDIKRVIEAENSTILSTYEKINSIKNLLNIN